MDSPEDTLLLNERTSLVDDSLDLSQATLRYPSHLSKLPASSEIIRKPSLQQSLSNYHGHLPPDASDDLAKLSIQQDTDDIPDSDYLTSLQSERDRLRTMNDMLESTIANVETAKAKLTRFQSVTAATHSLMDIYVRLMARANQTSELLLNGEYSTETDAAFVQQQEEEEAARVQEEKQRLEDEARQKVQAEKQQLQDSHSAPSNRGIPRGRGGRGSTRSLSINKASEQAAAETGRGAPTGRGSAQVTGVRGVRGLRSRVPSRAPT